MSLDPAENSYIPVMQASHFLLSGKDKPSNPALALYDRHTGRSDFRDRVLYRSGGLVHTLPA